MEETFRDHLVQLPDVFRNNQKLQHINESIVQMPPESWQTWGINHHSKKIIPVFHSLHNIENFSNVQSEPFAHVLTLGTVQIWWDSDTFQGRPHVRDMAPELLKVSLVFATSSYIKGILVCPLEP